MNSVANAQLLFNPAEEPMDFKNVFYKRLIKQKEHLRML